jgi:hypothetical protein
MNTYIINTNGKNEKDTINEGILKQFLDVKNDKEVSREQVVRFNYFFLNAEQTEKNEALKKYISLINVCDYLICCKGDSFVKVNTKNYAASEVGKLIKFLEDKDEKEEKKEQKNAPPKK